MIKITVSARDLRLARAMANHKDKFEAAYQKALLVEFNKMRRKLIRDLQKSLLAMLGRQAKIICQRERGKS